MCVYVCVEMCVCVFVNACMRVCMCVTLPILSLSLSVLTGRSGMIMAISSDDHLPNLVLDGSGCVCVCVCVCRMRSS